MRTAATVALQHHERIDGSGYLGLKGNEIHPHARLVAVADVFDALLSPRSYKRPWSIQRTSSYLSSLAGVELDKTCWSAVEQPPAGSDALPRRNAHIEQNTHYR